MIKWNIVTAKNGSPTIEVITERRNVYLHSRYNPEKETVRWIEQIDMDVTVKKIYVIGMGLGYHIHALKKKFPNLEIEVWDFNKKYKQWVLDTGIIDDLLASNTISYYSSESLSEINEKLLLKIEKHTGELIIHKPSLSVFPTDLKVLRDKLEDISFIKQSFLDKKEFIVENFNNNLSLNDPGISKYENNFKNKSFILVSAGPSLTKQLPLLKKMKAHNEIVIGCVGTALKPLLHYGINPNFVMLSDPMDAVYPQIENIDTTDLTLFYLSTANHKTVSAFKGNRYIVWQEGYKEAELKANLRNEVTIKTGGSVATCLLDLMVNLGAREIALVGQDLAHTDGKSHAENSAGITTINNDFVNYTVDSFDLTEKLPTTKNLTIYRKWFEQYNKAVNNDIQLWNCTEGGAHINGWNHISLQSIYKRIIND